MPLLENHWPERSIFISIREPIPQVDPAPPFKLLEWAGATVHFEIAVLGGQKGLAVSNFLSFNLTWIYVYANW